MKNMYKVLMSILLILTLVSTAISVKDRDTRRFEEPATNDNVPAKINQEKVIPYTDIWTVSSTNHFWPTLGVWKDVTGMKQTINLKYPSTVIVQFSSEVGTKVIDEFDSSASRILVRATVDGKVMPPGDIIFSENSPMESNAFNFKWDYMPAGTHVIKIQTNKYTVTGDGAAGDLWRKSMTIIANEYGH